MLLFSSSEGEVDLSECRIEDLAWEFLQIVVEGMDVE